MRKDTMKTETITGQLQRIDGVWHVRGRYPVCVLSQHLQSKPDALTAEGAEVEATVVPATRTVIDYHFT